MRTVTSLSAIDLLVLLPPSTLLGAPQAASRLSGGLALLPLSGYTSLIPLPRKADNGSSAFSGRR